MVLYGAALSLPSLALLWLALSVQYRRRQSEYGSWRTALAITFVLTAVPFVVISILTGLGIYVFGFAAAYLGGIWLGVYWAFGRTKFEQPLLGDEPLDANI